MLARKCFLLLASLVLFVSQLHAGRVFPVTGVVKAPLEAGRLVVAHDEIVGFMPAMTMAFEVADAARAAAAKLQTGERIAFNLDVDEAHARVTTLYVIGAGTPDRAAPAPQPAGATVRRLRVGDALPSFTLLDENGKTLSAVALSDRPTLITFLFTRCPVPEYCPLIARRFGQIQRGIGADARLKGNVRLLAVTLDPAFDRPEVLREYGRAVGADPAVWNFATGSEAEVSALVKAFSVYTERNGVTLDHTLCTALIDRDGRIIQLWRGNGWTIDEVLSALATTAG